MSMDGLEDEVAERRVKPQLVYPLGDPPEAGEAREIAPGVHWVRMPLPFALQWINLWLIEDGDGWTIVDTGVAIEQSREYWRAIFDATLKGKPVTRVICTHMHPDHMGLAGWICRKFGATLWMSRLEYITGRMLVADTGREAPEEGVQFYRAAGWDEDALDSLQGPLRRLRQSRLESAGRLQAHRRRRRDRDRRPAVARHHRQRPLPRACLPVAGRAEALHLRRPGAAAHLLQRLGVSHRARRRSAHRLDQLAARSCSTPCRTTCWCCPSHNEPFIGLHERLDESDRRPREGARARAASPAAGAASARSICSARCSRARSAPDLHRHGDGRSHRARELPDRPRPRARASPTRREWCAMSPPERAAIPSTAPTTRILCFCIGAGLCVLAWFLGVGAVMGAAFSGGDPAVVVGGIVARDRRLLLLGASRLRADARSAAIWMIAPSHRRPERRRGRKALSRRRTLSASLRRRQRFRGARDRHRRSCAGSVDDLIDDL